MGFRGSRILTVLLLVGGVALPGCTREERSFEEVSNADNPGLVRTSDLRPGPSNSPAQIPVKNQTHSRYDENAYAISEGQRLYAWFNCVGCHAHGGGGMGPALIDELWTYGSDPSQIFNTIAEGRPNGMPSFAARIGDQETWQLVAYVRSLSQQTPKDATPSREDSMNFKQPDAERRPPPPVNTRVP
jgi:cytochrome c oxidase cbb3-type subunit III